MYINPITHNINSYYKKQSNAKPVVFQAHPDFNKLAKDYEITASSFFRRGPMHGAAHKKFQEVVDIFNQIFSKNVNKPKNMLIAGIGNSQEPFSYLAVIKSIIKDKKLSEVLDLSIVDLQSKPSKNQLFKNSYYEYYTQPEYASSSFVLDYRENIRHNFMPAYYRVNDEIFDFLNSTYKDTKNSKFEQRIQEAITEYDNDKFDVISINNTLGYIRDENTIIKTLENLHRTLKPNGILITDPYYKYIDRANLVDNFETIGFGIFRKIK